MDIEAHSGDLTGLSKKRAVGASLRYIKKLTYIYILC